jgi:hypothetical protein
MTVRNALRSSVPAGALPDFEPVPRRSPRHDGWTPERQRAFVAALADTGCVSIAARMVNMSPEGAYLLRRQPGAEGFRRAWEAAQGLGLQAVKDEAFDRAMRGQLVPVFVGGKLMGFRRKKNDRLLMFILRHYGQEAGGRRTTINYFSTRATASAGAGSVRPAAGEAVPFDVANPVRDGASALAAAEASTTTVKTVISQPPIPNPQARDHEAADILNGFAGVPLDAEAQAEIYRVLESCAERRRALADDPENDPQCAFHRVAGPEYMGELESGAEWEDFVPFAEGEHGWEGLGEGGEAAEVDRVLAGMAERRARLTPEALDAEIAAELKRADAQAERQNLPLPKPGPDPDPDDPRLDWRNWESGTYTAPADTPSPSMGEGPGGGGASAASDEEGSASDSKPTRAEARRDHERRRDSGAVHEQEPDPAGRPAPGLDPGDRTDESIRLVGPPLDLQDVGHPAPDAGRPGGHSAKALPAPKRTYRPRTPKPPFTPPDAEAESRAREAVAADRRTAAEAQAARRARS